MHELKALQRNRGYQARGLQPEREKFSRIICERFMALPAFENAKTVMTYVGCRTEVETRTVLIRLMTSNKCPVIPYCTKDSQGCKQLGLWHLTDFSDLVPGTWGIPEPPKSRWGEADKAVSPGVLDLIMVPGVGFDRDGGRLGNGAGYYDRLLASVRADAVLCGVCFESQLFDKVAMEPHDIAMDYVVTEDAVYVGKGR